LIYLTGGKHIGQIGKIQDIIGNRILYKTESGDVVETLKDYAFPIGKDKPLIKLAN
jgi:ribosomal protein S4E